MELANLPVPVFIPDSVNPYLVPVEFFFNLFPPFSVTIYEIEQNLWALL